MAAAFGVGPGAPRYGERRHGDDTDRKRGRLLGGLSQVRAGAVRVRREGQGGAGDATTGGTAVGHDAGGPRGARGRARSVRRRVWAGDAGQWWGWRAQRRRSSGVTAAAASQRAAAMTARRVRARMSWARRLTRHIQ